MTTRTIISVVKTIQFRTEVLEEDGTVRHGWNHRYRSAHAAAENYARHKISEWEHEKWEVAKYGAAYHRQSETDRAYMYALGQRFYRMMVRHFKRVLA
jgi:hypothetical protein